MNLNHTSTVSPIKSASATNHQCTVPIECTTSIYGHNQCPGSLALGAHRTMSSTLKIISAASAAEVKHCSFDLYDSCTLYLRKSPMLPVSMHTPIQWLPSECSLRSLVTISAASKPALSAKILGICVNALAKASMASASLPFVFAASRDTACAISNSQQPPPSTTLLS